MKLGILPIHEMLAHSEVWLNDPRIRDALAADPIGRVLLEKLGLVHGKLSESQTQRLLMENRIADMTELLGLLDNLHDDLVRAIYFAITAAAHACKKPAKARVLWELRDTLFPGGLSIINASYMAQSGAAVEVKSRITPEIRARLRTITLDGRNLAELLDEWLDTAERIGRLAHERSSVIASISKDGTDADKVDRYSARREWLQVSQGLLSNLPFMNVPDKIREEIEASLARSVRNAERRSQPGTEPAPDTPADDDLDAAADTADAVADTVADTAADTAGDDTAHATSNGDLTNTPAS